MCVRFPHISCHLALSQGKLTMEACIYVGGSNHSYLDSTIALQKQLQEKPGLKELIMIVKQKCKVSRAVLGFQRNCRPC